MGQHIVVRMIGGAELLSSGQVTKERKKRDLLEGVPREAGHSSLWKGLLSGHTS